MPLTFQLASRGSRLLAIIVDGLLVGVIGFFIATGIGGIIFAQTGSLPTADPSSMQWLGVLPFVAIIAMIIVQFYLLAARGQTIGKILLHIKIVDINTGENGGFVPNVVMRTLVNGLLGIIPFYGLVDILFIFREDRRCVHDLIAKTTVINAQSTVAVTAPAPVAIGN